MYITEKNLPFLFIGIGRYYYDSIDERSIVRHLFVRG